MDCFTKRPEAYAIPNQEAPTVTEALVTTFFCRFEVPRDLHSDQCRESRLMQEIVQCLGVSMTRTTPRLYGGMVRQKAREAPAKIFRAAPEGSV
jgi:hypothetical protein